MKLDANGDLHIPADISRKAGFTPGVEVDVQIENGGLRIMPIDAAALRRRRMEEGLRELGDIPPPLKTADEVIALTRGED